MKRLLVLVFLASCSPLKTSLYDDGYQLELTIHEIKTNLDDVRHGLNSFMAQMQVFDARIKHYEDVLAALKKQDVVRQQQKIDQLTQEFASLEKRWNGVEKRSEEISQLITHSKEMAAALSQCKSRLEELEKEILAGERKFEELAKVKGNLETLARSFGKVYKVRPGDSLEKIAKTHRTSVERIKKANAMEQDLIVVGQEIKIPSE